MIRFNIAVQYCYSAKKMFKECDVNKRSIFQFKVAATDTRYLKGVSTLGV